MIFATAARTAAIEIKSSVTNLSFFISLFLMIKPKPAWAVNPRSILFAPWLALSLRCGHSELKRTSRCIRLSHYKGCVFSVPRHVMQRVLYSACHLAGVSISDTGCATTLPSRYPDYGLGLPRYEYSLFIES